MDKKINKQEKSPQEIPMKENPLNPQPEKDPNIKTNTNPNKDNPVNPKENR